jgi:hypothetical protein
MNQPRDGSLPPSIDAFLGGAYVRILRITMVLSAAAIIAATVWFHWRAGLGVAIGSALAYLKFVWLQHGAQLMVERVLTPARNRPSKLRLMLAFVLRYIFVITIAYVILKGYPRMLVGFIVGLALPILGAMCEGVYEAIAGSNKSTPNSF